MPQLDKDSSFWMMVKMMKEKSEMSSFLRSNSSRSSKSSKISGKKHTTYLGPVKFYFWFPPYFSTKIFVYFFVYEKQCILSDNNSIRIWMNLEQYWHFLLTLLPSKTSWLKHLSHSLNFACWRIEFWFVKLGRYFFHLQLFYALTKLALW